MRKKQNGRRSNRAPAKSRSRRAKKSRGSISSFCGPLLLELVGLIAILGLLAAKEQFANTSAGEQTVRSSTVNFENWGSRFE